MQYDFGILYDNTQYSLFFKSSLRTEKKSLHYTVVQHFACVIVLETVVRKQLFDHE